MIPLIEEEELEVIFHEKSGHYFGRRQTGKENRILLDENFVRLYRPLFLWGDRFVDGRIRNLEWVSEPRGWKPAARS